MDHEVLQRKLAHLEDEIRAAKAASLSGATPLSKVALTLDDAIRVAANIRNRLAGVPRAEGKQQYHVSKRGVVALDEAG